MTLQIETIVAKTGDLPAMPEVATKVMRMIGQQNTNAHMLQETISADQGMTLQILKIANSSLFGLKREVKTLSHAIALLGFNTIRAIVLASATKNLYAGKQMGLKERLLWDKSIGCAMIARQLAENDTSIDKEEAFIGGLMHNVGQSVFNSRFMEQYDAVVQEHYNEETPIHLIERRVFGFDHCDLGHALTKKWNLSDTITQTLLHYLTPEDAPVPLAKLVAMVHLAYLFCLDLGIGVRQTTPLEQTVSESILTQLGIEHKHIDFARKKIQELMNKENGSISQL
jgi:HD-like signal output (HDOD) protein